MTIGKLAQRAGVGIETIRYYQRIGLIDVPESDLGWRVYGEESLTRLRFIKIAQKHGFTLKEIGVLILHTLKPSLELEVQQLIHQKLLSIQKDIKQLDRISASLSKAITPNHLCETEDCCLRSWLNSLKGGTRDEFENEQEKLDNSADTA
jgi:MerR family mercuric resistance operon transcriptional regulator